MLFVDEFMDVDDTHDGGFGKPVWFDRVKAEYWACREGVCLIDMSTFAKFELTVSACFGRSSVAPANVALFRFLISFRNCSNAECNVSE